MEELQKEFVPYDRALRMKALGFNEPCAACYYKKFDNEIGYHKVYRDFNFVQLTVSAPTFSQAFRWLREKHELTWEHSFDDSQIQLYVGKIAYPDNCLDFFKSIDVKYDCYNKAFEEAELACLDKLLEIVESKSE